MFWDEIEELRKEENKGREADNWFLGEKKIKYIRDSGKHTYMWKTNHILTLF